MRAENSPRRLRPAAALSVPSPQAAPQVPPNSTDERKGCLSHTHDGLELRKRRRGGGRGRGGADDAGRAVPDQRGAGRAALQVPQGAPGPPRRPQPRGLILLSGGLIPNSKPRHKP